LCAVSMACTACVQGGSTDRLETNGT
jgi:hypothetical protein